MNCHDAIEGWEWDNVFLLPDHSLLEQDTIIGTWQDEFSESTATQPRVHSLEADLGIASASRNGTVQFTSRINIASDQEPLIRIASDGSPASSEYDRQTAVSDPNNQLENSLGNSSGFSRKKKRDPRLDCPNFLAGRIPCSCPEIDEADDGENEDTGKKRPKAAARCQVPSCGGNISHLKGYHQRHRVCLECANSPEVLLRDQPHRYCQQCGKFHRLSDFDEGKRSCRRKLERHNKRRRRRPSEAGDGEETATPVPASEKDNLDAGSSSADAPSQGKTRITSPSGGVRQNGSAHNLLRKPSTEPEQVCQATNLHTEQIFLQSKEDDPGNLTCEEAAQCITISGQVHSPAGREGESILNTNLPIYESSPCQQLAENPVRQSREENFQAQSDCAQNGAGLARGFAKLLENNSVEGHHASDASSAIALRLGQEMLRSNKNRLDEQSWLAMLMDDRVEGAEFPSSLKGASQMHTSKPEPQRSSFLSSGHKRCSGYVSPCPTGRVSFKLYDWNPADFPRRLRQQIFEWLANMPVELEGYIRSGCIILTFFITMFKTDWDKIMGDWIGHVQNIILGPVRELWGTGQIIACLNDRNVHIANGKILRACYKEDLTATLVDVYPLALETGCASEIYIFGFNLGSTKSRFFLSFGEECLKCNVCEPVEESHYTQRKAMKNEDGLEIRKLAVCLPEWKKFGPAYVEVDNDYGVSNAIPLLVADKGVCAEVNSLGLSPESCTSNHETQAHILKTYKTSFSGRECFADLLTDLGWVFRYTEDSRSMNRAKARIAFRKRFERLLPCCAGYGWGTVTKRLLYAAVETGLVTELESGLDGPKRQLMIDSNIMKDFKCSIDINVLENISLLEYLLDEITVAQSFFSLSNDTRCKADCNNGSVSQYNGKGSHATDWGSAMNKVEPIYSLSLEPELTCSTNAMSMQACKESLMDVPLLEKRIQIMEDTLQHNKNPFGWLKMSARNLGSMHIYNSTDRKFRQIAFTAVSLIMLCVGMCVVLQHPHQVAEMSMSLRRCLWGSIDGTLPLA